MDVLKLFLKFLVFLLAVFVVGLVASREYFLVKTVTLVDNDFKQLFRSYTGNSALGECRAQFGEAEVGLGADVYQLRFIDKRTYVTEVLCHSLSSQTVSLKQVTLPPFVFHNAVGSGFIANHEDEVEMVGFEVMSQSQLKWLNPLLHQLPFIKKDFYLVKDRYHLEKQTGYDPQKGAVTSAGPKTTCAGYGFSCCNPVTSLGQGEPKPAVTDCAEHCYVTCQPRPMVLAFNASNNYDPYTKTVSLNNNQSVSFAVIVDDNKMEIGSVAIDFGDGQNARLSGQGPFEISHNYVCNQAQCVYLAKAQASTPTGITSYDSSAAQIKVVVRR